MWFPQGAFGSSNCFKDTRESKLHIGINVSVCVCDALVTCLGTCQGCVSAFYPNDPKEEKAAMNGWMLQ